MKLSELFDVISGSGLDFNKMTIVKNADEESVNFVSRAGRNQGVAGRVKRVRGEEPFDEGLISVALGGSVLSSFVQQRKFYTGEHMKVLKPKKKLTLQEKLYYCMCIKQNEANYTAFGREADRSIKQLEIPDFVPLWVNDFTAEEIPTTSKTTSNIELTDRKWKSFVYSQLFDVEHGSNVLVREITPNGQTPLISALKHNNGFSGMVDMMPQYTGNLIVVNNNGNGGVGESFYQSMPFCATVDVSILKPKFELNKYIAMFLISIIKRERYRYSFGRKWSPARMRESDIMLPVDEQGDPDWKFMEDYIESLPYSSNLK